MSDFIKWSGDVGSKILSPSEVVLVGLTVGAKTANNLQTLIKFVLVVSSCIGLSQVAKVLPDKTFCTGAKTPNSR